MTNAAQEIAAMVEIMREPLGVAADGLTPAEMVHLLCQYLETANTRKPLACFDCGMAYGGPGWCETLVPDWAWRRICPHEFSRGGGGILCFNCTAIRLDRAGLARVPLAIVTGPFETCDPDLDWIRQDEPLAVAALESE